MVSIQNSSQGVHEDVRVIAVVEAPFQFFKVEVKMLDADLRERYPYKASVALYVMLACSLRSGFNPI